MLPNYTVERHGHRMDVSQPDVLTWLLSNGLVEDGAAMQATG
jgi:hypothetical protein